MQCEHSESNNLCVFMVELFMIVYVSVYNNILKLVWNNINSYEVADIITSKTSYLLQ